MLSNKYFNPETDEEIKRETLKKINNKLKEEKQKKQKKRIIEEVKKSFEKDERQYNTEIEKNKTSSPLKNNTGELYSSDMHQIKKEMSDSVEKQNNTSLKNTSFKRIIDYINPQNTSKITQPQPEVSQPQLEVSQPQNTLQIIGNSLKRNTTPKDANPQQLQPSSETNNTAQPQSTFGKIGNIFKGKTIQSVFSSFANKNGEIIDKNVDKHIKLNEELKKYNIKASLVSGIRVNEGAMLNTSMILMTQKGQRQIEEFITSVIETDKKNNNGKINFLKFSLLDEDKERSNIIDSLREIKNFGVYDNLIVDNLFMSRLTKITDFINNEPLLKDYNKIFDACKKLTKNLYVNDTAQPEKVKDVIINIIWIINYLISVFEVKLFIMSAEDRQIKSDKFKENCKSITSVILFTYYLLVLTIGGNYNNYKNGEVVNINTNIDMTILKSIAVYDFELPKEVSDIITTNVETYRESNKELDKSISDKNWFLWGVLNFTPSEKKVGSFIEQVEKNEQMETRIRNTLKNSKALGFDIDVLSMFKNLCNNNLDHHLKKYFFIFNLIYSEIYELKNDTTFSKNESGNFFKINDNIINLFNEYKSNQITENATYNKLRKNIDIVYDYTEIINVDNPRYEFIKDTKNPKINKMNYNVNNRLIGGNDGGMKTRPLSKQNKTRKIYK